MNAILQDLDDDPLATKSGIPTTWQAPAAANAPGFQSTAGIDPNDDPLAARAAGIPLPAPKRKYVSPLDDPSTRSGQGGIAGNLTDVIDTALGKVVGGTVGSVVGGYKALADLLRGKGMDAAADEVNNFAAKTAYQPGNPSAAAQNTAAVLESPWNPLNLPTTVGHGLGRGAEALGAPPSVSAGLEALPTAASAVLGLRAARGIPGGLDTPTELGEPAPKITAATPANDPTLVPAMRAAASAKAAGAPSSSTAPGMGTAAGPNLTLAPSAARVLPAESVPGDSLDLSLAPSAPRSIPGSTPTGAATPQPPLTASGLPRGSLWEPPDLPASGGAKAVKVDAEPAPGGLPDEAAAARAAILNRVGIDSVRDSSLKGDALAAGSDAQMTRFNEAAGQAAKAQFDAEKEALQKHVSGMINDFGGSVGTDEDSLNNRGQTIAAPFDALRDYFKAQQKAAYDAADERGGGKPVTTLDGVDDLLNKNNDFKETLLARDQGGLLGSMQRQLNNFKELNPDGFTVSAAENFRKWLNQAWTPENRYAVGQVKDALDNDVLKGAGEDIYGPARQLTQLKAQLLDNPDGVSTLFDRDPMTPMNRVTPYSKIPDTLTRLDPEQFRNVLQTLREMPQEVQPQAQAAIGEIQGHLLNKLLDAGTQKAPESFWNSPSVSDVLKKNSSKFNMAFGNDPEAIQGIRDLDSAGRILRANPAYPGAAAQASNAIKRGLMTRAIEHVATGAGAAVGSTFGHVGAAMGAAAGEALASRATQGAGEKAALARWNSGLTKLSDVVPK